ncbi:MAG: malectin domain-containing carbohydrate-binding protein, partial [Armatimonadota bacterium]
ARQTQVPWTVQDAFPECHGVFWYWREFTPVENPHEHGRYLLRFWAVDYMADVWVNDIHVGGHEGGETPFTLDVTDAIRPSEVNRVCVRVLNPTNERIDGILLCEIPHSNKTIPYRNGCSFNVGGIIESVELLAAPGVRIEELWVMPDVKTGAIRVRAAVRNSGVGTVAGRVRFAVAPAASGETIAISLVEREFPLGEALVETEIVVDNPHLWDLADPFLYRVSVGVEASGSLDERSVRCGFRDFRVENGYFRLNGKRIFLRSTHTGNHCPVGNLMSPKGQRDLLLQDLLYAKTLGFNMVRFIARVAHPYQLDFCDEIGLMVYEESYAAWQLADSPDMQRRFDFSTREMILRDRNHPCVTIWGMLNETRDSPTYRHAKESLSLVRSLDDTSLVLLSSGRWDAHASVGSVSNPGSNEWEHVWGVEAPDGPRLQWVPEIPGYLNGAGDAHIYPEVPHSPEVENLIRTLGKDSKPVFLSEYGIGSTMNSIRELRKCEEAGLNPDAEDIALLRSISEKFVEDWNRLGFDGTYPFPEDMLRDSQRLMARWRLRGFDLIRSNPKICGYNLTGMLDHGMTGEGVWTFWREWKPGIVDAISDGWAPLRWCLFVSPTHGYSGGRFELEAVLANENVLEPGDYPVRFRISGPSGVVWERKTTLSVAQPDTGLDVPLAMQVIKEEVTLDIPAGTYEFVANMERGGAPAGGRRNFYVSAPKSLPKVECTVTLWGVDKRIEDWLTSHGVRCAQFKGSCAEGREVILVGLGVELLTDLDGWSEVAKRMGQGSSVIFASPTSFRRGTSTSVGRLEITGNPIFSLRDFEVSNVPRDEWKSFNTEFYGDFGYALTDLPDQEYRVELGMCEGFVSAVGERVFDVLINDQVVLERFDVLKEAGGPKLAVKREFRVQPKDGVIRIGFAACESEPSACRLKVFDEHGDLVLHYDVPTHLANMVGWLPLEKKGRYYRFHDWLYHKECVAKLHPIFDGLQSKGIMDWDYYGEVISHDLLDGQDTPDDVAVAAFAIGHDSCPGGYASGIMVCSYPFGAGRFILNTLRVLENVGTHPAADRLLLNMINYAASLLTIEIPGPRPDAKGNMGIGSCL